MPAYKGSDHFPDAVKSILRQSFDDLELIIVLDPHPDDICDRYLSSISDDRLKIIRNKNRLGLTRSRNIALSRAMGSYIAVMDSDDISLPQRLRSEHRFLELNKEYVIVGTNAIIIDEDNNTIRKEDLEYSEEELFYRLHFANQFPHSSVMMRKKDVLEVGGYDERFGFGEDYHLFLKLLDRGRFRKMKMPLIKWRKHSESVSYAYEIEKEEDRVGNIIEEFYKRRYGSSVTKEMIRLFRNNSRIDINLKETARAIGSLEELNSMIISNAPVSLDRERLVHLARIKRNSLVTGQLFNRRKSESLRLILKRPDLIPSLIKHWASRM